VEELFYPHYPSRTSWEKNWAFFSQGGNLYAVYSIAPHQVLKIDGSEAKLAFETENHAEWQGGLRRGGAPPVLVENEWHHFFHDRIHNDGMPLPVYRTGLYTFEAEPPFAPKRHIVNPILVADHATNKNNPADVAFVGGAIYQNGQWILAHGCHDQFSSIDFFSAVSLERRLQVVPK
jgi:predicted GH43/DUF377 family glycosyl hydrolase